MEKIINGRLIKELKAATDVAYDIVMIKMLSNKISYYKAYVKRHNLEDKLSEEQLVMPAVPVEVIRSIDTIEDLKKAIVEYEVLLPNEVRGEVSQVCLAGRDSDNPHFDELPLNEAEEFVKALVRIYSESDKDKATAKYIVKMGALNKQFHVYFELEDEAEAYADFISLGYVYEIIDGKEVFLIRY